MNYVYSGRLQPLSKLNEEELFWIYNNIKDDDKMIIGIVNPNPSYLDESDLAFSWARFRPQFNPLSYWERYEMVYDFIHRSGIYEKVSAVVPLPRPSTNMKRAANYLPNERRMCLSIIQNNETEESKEFGMQRQGEIITKIPAYTFGSNFTIISPELIFCLIAIHNDKWRQLVSSFVYEYLKTVNIENRVISTLHYDDAKDTIRRIFNRASDNEEKNLIYEIIKDDFPNLPPPFIYPHYVENTLELEISDFRQMVNDLYLEILRELPLLEKGAPEQFSVFSQDAEYLKSIRHSIDCHLLNDRKELSIGMNEFSKIIERWKNR